MSRVTITLRGPSRADVRFVWLLAALALLLLVLTAAAYQGAVALGFDGQIGSGCDPGNPNCAVNGETNG